MDHSPYSKSSYGQAATEGSNWAEGQQKNAYARLVQQHHSGRFKFYLNYIAQKLQQEECAHGDPVCDKDSAFAGAIKDGQGKNGMSACSSRSEKGSEPGNNSKNRVAAVQKHQHCRDINEDLDLGEKCKTRTPQNRSNLPSSKGSHNYECKKEPRHEVSKSHHSVKSISQERHSEGMVSACQII